MLSTELPITEWWDPEWDTYDVPHTPNNGWWVDSPREDEVDVWWAAYEHLWLLRWIRHGTAEYIPVDYQHQLTTGTDVLDVVTHDAVGCAICAPFVGPLFVVAEHRPPRCTCAYRPEVWLYRDGTRRERPILGTGFLIDWDCPHHGDNARIADLPPWVGKILSD